MISQKTILSGFFSLMIGLALLVVPASAMAHDWDHDSGWHHDNGRHEGWERHQDRGDHDWDHDRWRGGDYRSYRPNYGYGYHHEPDADDYYRPGYGYNNGFYQRRYYGRNGAGMINPRHPNLMWACDTQGHHCHWAPRPGAAYQSPFYPRYGYAQPGAEYSAYDGYNQGYGYGANPLSSVIGPLLGVPIQ
jgi:hypothetical protein